MSLVRSPKLSVVVLNWNGKEDLLECLNSLERTTYSRVEVVVVDNNSTDGSVEVIRREFPQVLVIENQSNDGFGANNLGIREALSRGAEYVMLLNNDTWVEPDCLRKLIDAAQENPMAGVLGPRICYYHEPRRIWYDGGKLETRDGIVIPLHIHGEESIDALPLDSREVDYVCGCAMLIRRKIIERIGGLDPTFFAYWEDTDFSLRARRSGYRLLHIPSALVLHKVSRSSGGNESENVCYYMWRNQYLLSRRQYGLFFRPYVLSKYLRHCFWEYCERMRMNQKEQALAIAEAGWHSLIGHYGKRVGRIPSPILALLERQRVSE
jgi:GT2 family glycosyltransferase